MSTENDVIEAMAEAIRENLVNANLYGRYEVQDDVIKARYRAAAIGAMEVYQRFETGGDLAGINEPGEVFRKEEYPADIFRKHAGANADLLTGTDPSEHVMPEVADRECSFQRSGIDGSEGEE